MKHKHAELIIAWANGEQIQVLSDDWWDIGDPGWYEYKKYRVKPNHNKELLAHVGLTATRDLQFTSKCFSSLHPANVKFTFNHETGEFITVEKL